MPDYSPIYAPGIDVSWTVGASAVTGGQLVVVSAAGTSTTNGSVIAAAGASALVVGVAQHDAPIGGRVNVTRGGIQELTASGAITALSPLKSAASGRVTTMTIGTDPHDQLIGYALTAASTAGDLIRVHWVK